MYIDHFALTRKPFELSPDSSFLFLGEAHKEALAILKHGVVSDRGFLLFTGGVGTGKTTLISVVASTLEVPGYLCVISNPTLDIDDFFHYFAAQLGLLFDGNKAKFLFLFGKLLEECGKNGRKVLLIIDEAHALPTVLLEELRLLVNMAAENSKVLTVFLVGQPELLGRLSEEQLQPLAERIAVRHHLEQLNQEDCLKYIRFRLHRAGAKDAALFSDQALALIYQSTGGNPRQINVLCDNCLLRAFIAGRNQVDSSLVRSCIEQLRIADDDSAFTLPPEGGGGKRWLLWGAAAVVLAELVVGVYAYQQGWLQPVLQYLKIKLSMG